MFCDTARVRIGDATIIVRRMTIKEIRESREIFAQGKECLDESYTRLVAEHCKFDDDTPVDPSALSLPQLTKLAKEMAGAPEGSPLSDFIGLLL